LVIFAGVAGSVATLLLPETLRQRATEPFSFARMLALYPSVLAHRGFLANLGIMTTTFIGLFAWVSGAPIVMQGAIYGLTPLAFGVIFALGAGGYMLGTFTAARVVMRIGIDRTMGIGCVTLAAGGLIMAAVVALHLGNVIWFVGSMMIYLTGLGLALPAAMAGALTPFHDRAGTASSLMGFTQQSGAAIAAAAVGLYLGKSAWPVAGTVASMGCVALLIWALTRKVRGAEHGI
jgi:MFS transporter, DHA1 family, multidrug resistance protein